MSQYKVLPSYSEISPITKEFEEASSFSHFSLIYRDGGQDRHDEENNQQAGDLQNMQTLVEVHSPMSEQSTYFPWEQESVRNLQQALNSQPTVINQQTSLQPVSYATLWDPMKSPDLEGQETLDLSSTSNIPSYNAYSPPPSRLTILHPRHVVMTHPLSGQPIAPVEGLHHEHQAEESLHSHPMTSLQDIKEEKRTRTKSKDGDEDRPCKVCGEKAGKHSYYGGQVCPSCRAFFRRSVQSGYNATYFCVKEGDCEVNLKTRKNCQFCRYKLCEAAGMKTTWVLTEEERKLKFEGKGKRKRSSSIGNGDNQEGILKASNNSALLQDDLAHIGNFVEASGYWETSKVNDMNTELIRKIIRMIAFRADLDQVGQEQLQAVMVTRVKKFANKLTEFHSLCTSDKDKILSHNLPLVVTLSTCSMFSPNLLWTNQLSPLIGSGEVDKLDTKLRTLNVTGLDSLEMTYRQFFNRQTMNDEDERCFIELIADIGSWQQDPTELVLLSLTILFSPDLLDLTDRRKVEHVQLKFAVLLQKYLNYRHNSDLSQARSRFARGMMVVSKCREMDRLEPKLL